MKLSALRSSVAPFRLYNVGNHSPVDLLEVIRLLEEELGKKAKVNLLPMQAGDVTATFANVDSLQAATGFAPATTMKQGIHNFVEWYREFYK